MCAKMLEGSLFGLYHRAMGYNLVMKIKEHKEALKPLESRLGIDLDDCAKQIKTLREFDTVITSRVHGYKTTDNYYRQASSAIKLQNITIPCLLFFALDDPVTS